MKKNDFKFRLKKIFYLSGAIFLFLLLLTGCNTDITEKNSQDNPAEPEILSELILSDTHIIKLIKQSDNLYILSESGNMDLDKDHTKLAELDIQNLSLTEIYDKLSGSSWNETERNIYKSIDLSLEKNQTNDIDINDSNEDSELYLMEDDTIYSKKDTTNSGMEANAIYKASYNWQADDGWFKNNFCGNDSYRCYTSGEAPHYQSILTGYKKTKKFKATGYAQSFNNKAKFTIELETIRHFWGWKSYELVRDITLNPRSWHSTACVSSGNKYDFYYRAGIKHLSGSESPRRVALAVHLNF